MLLSPIAGLIIVSSSIRLSVIQDLFHYTNQLNHSMTYSNHTNTALKEALDAMTTEVNDLHINLCNIRRSRENRQVLTAAITGATSAIITLIAVSGRFLNYIDPKG